MPANEAHLDAPAALRRVRYRGGAFTDHLGGVSFVDSVAQSGMAASTLARLVGIGLPIVDLGPWEDAPSPAPVVAVAPPVEEPPPPAEPVAIAPRVIPAPIPPARSDRRR